jgi:O-antigen/teichoic acid export membrane protein
MLSRLKYFEIISKLGIDKAIAFNVLARIIQAGGGLLVVILVAKNLNQVEQGYYFTFGSVLAIQIFFELGLNSIITQFVAHESAHVKWDLHSEIDGTDSAISRLSALLKFCVRWFTVIGGVLLIVLIIVGYFFFDRFSASSDSSIWQLPWLISCVSTSCSLIFNPILSYAEGLGQVEEVAKLRFLQQTTQMFLLVFFFFSGFKLMSSPLASIISCLIVPVWFHFSKIKRSFLSIWKIKSNVSFSYTKELFPLQWRIALSWISGYFMYQLFNPVLFATEGPSVAGQMGLTLGVMNGILAISLSWINTKVPLFSSLISTNEINRLNRIFKQTIVQASSVCAIFLFFFITVILLFNYRDYKLAARFLPIVPLIMLCVTTFLNQLISALATYMRCHKKEPLVLLSVVVALLTAASTLLLGNKFGLMGIIVGYLIITLISFFWCLSIFNKKRKEWHFPQ